MSDREIFAANCFASKCLKSLQMYIVGVKLHEVGVEVGGASIGKVDLLVHPYEKRNLTQAQACPVSKIEVKKLLGDRWEKIVVLLG